MRQPPFKKRGIVRSLSSMIQGLRKQEDDRLDEELEMIRELEDGDDDGSAARPAVQVEDSQVVMPLGPDRAPESEEDEEEEQETGVFRKPWKKKGQKRQTKRTNSKFLLPSLLSDNINTIFSAAPTKAQTSNPTAIFSYRLRRRSLR